MKRKYCCECGADILLNEEYYQSSDDHICKRCYLEKFPKPYEQTMMYYFGTTEPSLERIAFFIEAIATLASKGKDVESYMEDVSLDNGGYYYTVREDEDDCDEEDEV